MLTREHFNYLNFSRVLKIGGIFIGLSFIILLCAKGLSRPKNEVIPLMHDGVHLIVPEASPLRKIISTKSVTKEQISIPFTLPAVVKAIPTQLVNVFPPVLGRIVSVNKEAGDAVVRGDVLFTINSADTAMAVSDVEKATASFSLAQQALERQKKLMAAKIGSIQDQQNAENNYEQALSELTRATDRLRMLKIHKPDSVKNGNLIVRAPLSGHVLEVNAGVGGYWNDPNAPIMTVADLSSVYVVANAQEKDLAKIYIGQNANITVDGYSKTYRAKIDYISPVLDPDTRTVAVSIRLDNKDGHLRPNMFTRAVLMIRPYEGVMLPLTAVIQRGFDSIVFVETAPWQFEPRIVQVGSQLDDHVEIRSGLHDKEQVVLTGGIVLND
jgi:cobalt-zinc-cadmium efflux system membrane fusion protein